MPALTLENLVDLENIKRMKYRYIRALDTHDWDLMRTLFVEDAHVWFSGGLYKTQGVDKIIALYKELLNPDFVSSHIVVQAEIDFLDADSATGTWRMEDTVHFMNDNKAVAGFSIDKGDVLMGAGYYRDEYEKVAGEWKLRSSGFVRIWETVEKIGQRQISLKLDPKRGVAPARGPAA